MKAHTFGLKMGAFFGENKTFASLFNLKVESHCLP